ncbi:MAG TPA: restriction endonuclease subunit S [Methylotenera sp.]|nr:restriction endonuclease subunit S [Methylotenera sp.]HPV45487.1 restriction endonuclease subunit S [Methylotenera sp.]
MENLPALNLKKLDKSQWKTYRFDEIAKNISERVDPNNTDLEVYVGLEHIDSESIHLKRSGTPDDVDGQKLRFYPGDVIFGRRRAYQRKAAVATTHGFCSAHALVLRAYPDVIDPQLFPFFMHSDAFMHRAVDISVGSLSPTINWGTLKNEEFKIPPKEYQKEYLELLSGCDLVFCNEEFVLHNYKKFYITYLNELIDKHSELEGNEVIRLGNLGSIYGGLTGKSKDDFGTGSPFVTYMNVFKNTRINLDMLDYVKIEKNEKQNQVIYGDIIFTGSSETPEEVGMTSVLLDEVDGIYLNSFCFGFRLKNFDQLTPQFARFLFQTRKIRDFIIKHAQGSTRFNLSKSVITEKLKVKLPTIVTQKKVAADLAEKEDFIKTLEMKIKITESLKNKLINQIF